MRHVLTCQLSACERYRYLLRVAVADVSVSDVPPSTATPHLLVILKNPSTADATRGDPTTGKVEAWARAHGFSIVTYLNLFALRSPHPRRVNEHPYAESVGSANDAILHSVLAATHNFPQSPAHCAQVVAAWGNPNGIDPSRYQRRIAEVLSIIDPHCAGQLCMIGEATQQGNPRHGLQWQRAMPMRSYADRTSTTSAA